MRRAEWVFPWVLGVVAAILSWRALPEFDFGWHLAGGLWLTETRSPLGLDPFHAEARTWAMYSWLFSLFLALIFRISNFEGLLLTQGALIAGTLLGILHLYRSRAKAATLTELCLFSVVLVGISPFLYLRPQLLSLAFIALALSLIAQRVSQWKLVPLTFVWVQLHVYWIFAPLLTGFAGVLRRDGRGLLFALILIAVGMASPLGVENVRLVSEYIADHQEAELLIAEFRSLGVQHGMYFYLHLVCGVCLLVAACRRRFWEEPFLASWLVLAYCIGWYQVKYVPLFYVSLIPFCAHWFADTSTTGASARSLWLAGSVGYLSALALLYAIGQGLPSPLSPRDRSILALVGQLPNREGVVLNQFNEGGILAFALHYLDKPAKTSIDGRTLVMGAQRLKEYSQLRAGSLDRQCAILRSWRVTYALLREADPLASTLLDARCGTSWKVLAQQDGWQLLQEQSGGEDFYSKPIGDV